VGVAEALKLKYPPIAILWDDEKPEKVQQFKQGKWGCVILRPPELVENFVNAMPIMDVPSKYVVF
jgi:hypothetical protein